MTGFYLALLALLGLGAFIVVRGRAVSFAGPHPHSRPIYHGMLASAQVALPMLAILVIGMPLARWFAENQALALLDPTTIADDLRRGAALRDIRDFASGRGGTAGGAAIQAAGAQFLWQTRLSQWTIIAIGLVAGVTGLLYSLRMTNPMFRARNRFEKIVKIALLACAGFAVLTTIGIVFSVLFETIRFFQRIPPTDFLFGTEWSPQTAIRADQAGSSGAFGILPLVAGTALVSLIAMLVAGPIGLFAAIYLAEYATPRFRSWAKPLLEVLAGIPTVVLGFFAALTVAPVIRDAGTMLGLNVASESALAAGLVMGMMIIPFISSLSDDVINSVPQSLRDGSLAMGATKSETIRRVVLPAALPGIVSAFMLAISRAVGETMIVVMAAGLAANLTFNPLDAVTTFTVQIKTILVGDQEFDSAKTLAAFALGFVLFFFTLTLNVIALAIIRKYREQYD